MKAKMLAALMLIGICAYAQYPVFSGGNNDGNTNANLAGVININLYQGSNSDGFAFYSGIAPPPLNLYAGGGNDGFSSGSTLPAFGFNLYNGGNNDGYTTYKLTNTALSMYSGGGNDGAAFYSGIAPPALSFYMGGHADGVAYNKIQPANVFAMYKGGNADGFAWDDNTTPPVFCGSPTILQMLGNSPTTITLGWTPGAGNTTYEVILVRTNPVDTIRETGAITGSPMSVTIGCLPQFTFFNYFIRESCGANSYSPWVNGFTAYTSPGGCQQPGSQASTTTSATVANLSWVSNYSPSTPKPYQISYGSGITNAAQGTKTAVLTPQLAQINGATITHQLTVGAGVANVNWFVREVCAQCDTTLWTGPHTISAYNPGGGSGNCVVPTNQALIYPGTTNFGVRWTSPYYQQAGYSYQVVGGYGITSPAQATVFSSGTYTSMQFSYPSALVLASSANFTWWVRNICGPGDTTAWAGPHTIGSSKTDETTGIEESSKTTDWTIYPNPNHGNVLYMNTGSAEAKEIRINDVAGKLILQKQSGEEQLLQLDVSSLASGLYIVQLLTNGEVLTKPLSINK
jgi:hypothetical protein